MLTAHPPGLIGDIASWIDSCAVHPAPTLSVAAAISVVSTLAGRRYCLPSGARACTYVIGVAQSGVGKEVGRQCAVSLLDRAGLRKRVGSGGIASGAGLVTRLSTCPTQLFLLDEFGRLLEAFSGKNAASHEREIMTVLMSLWGAHSGVFLGKAYAEKDQPTIELPHCVLYGTTTPDAFYAALKGRDVVDGVLSRMIILEVDHGQLAEVHPTGRSNEPPAELVRRCKALAQGPPGDSNLEGIESSTIATKPRIVALSPEAQAHVATLSAGITVKLGATEYRDLWVRAKEQALRVALACALGCESDRVEVEHLQWAWSIVRWSTRRMELAVAARVADTEEGRCQLAWLAAIADAGGRLDRRDATRGRHLRRFDARTRKVALGCLIDSEAISLHSVATMGRAREIYTITDAEKTAS